MQRIKDSIKTNIGKKVFVFPSEAAADYWRRGSLETANTGAVRNDWFISWDSFKELISLHDRKDRPVNAAVRQIFVSSVLKKNRTEGFFRYIVPESFREFSSAYSRAVLRMLPELKALVSNSAFREDGGQVFDDYDCLYRLYSDFMDRYGFFEPSWELPDLKDSADKFIVFMPSVIEDAEDLRPSLAARGCSFVDDESEVLPEYSLYGNSEIEAEAVAGLLAGLLEKGVSVSDIAVTSADRELSARIVRKAVLRGLPVSDRNGKPLSDYPEGRLPGLIKECCDSMFSLESVKALLMLNVFKWKEADKARGLVRFGILNRCLRNYGSGRDGDEWGKRLAAIDGTGLLAFYRQLKSSLNRIYSAATLSELSSEFQIFLSSFIVTESSEWNPESEKVFQRCREVLGGLVETESMLAGMETGDPLGLWIDALAGRIYVRQSEGIPIYPYRVSAGMEPEWHIIAGLSNSGSAAVSAPFGFLGDRQRKSLGVAERNMTDSFIRVYAQSGKHVVITGSSETETGAALVPSLFVSEGVVLRKGQPETESPYGIESVWWEKGGQAPPDFLHPVQAEGMAYAFCTSFQSKGADFTREDASPVIAQRLIRRDPEGGGTVYLSHSSLRKWCSCRFSYLLSGVLGIHEDEYILKPEDPQTEGQIMHEVLYAFFKALKDGNEPFCADMISGYEETLRAAADRTLEKWSREKNSFYGPAWDAAARRIAAVMPLILPQEAEFNNGLFPLELEQKFVLELEDDGICITGYVDRISGDDSGAVIIDYKKNAKKLQKNLYVTGEDGSYPYNGFQIPLYILMAESRGYRIRGAFYYSIEDGEFRRFCGEGGIIDDEEMDDLKAAALDAARDAAAAVRAGDYRAAEDCESCSFRNICRTKYLVR